MTQTNKYIGLLGAFWGFVGAFGLISYAIWRLTPHAVNALDYPLTLIQWAALIANVVFMAYSEGYKGFQLAFAPRVAARCLYISRNPSLIRLLLAPLFAVGYFDATKRRLLISYMLTTMIIILVVIVHGVPQPWRGIIDAGVVIGLAWGLASMLYYIVLAFSVDHYAYSPEVSQPVTDT